MPQTWGSPPDRGTALLYTGKVIGYHVYLRSVGFARMDSFRSKNGEHVTDRDMYIWSGSLSLSRQTGRYTSIPPVLFTLRHLYTVYQYSRLFGVPYWGTYSQTARPATRSVSGQLTASFRLERTDTQCRDQSNHPCWVCHVELHRGPSRYTTQGSPPVSPPLHRMVERTSQRVPCAILCGRTCQHWL